MKSSKNGKRKKIIIFLCILVIGLIAVVGVHWYRFYYRDLGNTMGNAMNLGGEGVQTDDAFLFYYDGKIFSIKSTDEIAVYDKLITGNCCGLFYYDDEVYCVEFDNNHHAQKIYKIKLDEQELEEIIQIDSSSDICVLNGKIYYVEYNQEDHKDKLYSINLDGSNKKYIGECDYLEFVQLYVKGQMDELPWKGWMYVEKVYDSTYQANKKWWYIYEDVECQTMGSYVEKMVNYPRRLYRVSGDTGERYLLDENVTACNVGEKYIYYAKQSQDENVSYIYRCDLVGNDKIKIAEIQSDKLMTCMGIYVGDDVLACVMWNLSSEVQESAAYVIDLDTLKIVEVQ